VNEDIPLNDPENNTEQVFENKKSFDETKERVYKDGQSQTKNKVKKERLDLIDDQIIDFEPDLFDPELIKEIENENGPSDLDFDDIIDEDIVNDNDNILFDNDETEIIDMEEI